MTEPVPCACGSTDVGVVLLGSRFYVRCLACGDNERGAHATRDLAVEAWNAAHTLRPYREPTLQETGETTAEQIAPFVLTRAPFRFDGGGTWYEQLAYHATLAAAVHMHREKPLKPEGSVTPDPEESA